VIENVAKHEAIDLDHVGIINPETSSELPAFCRRLERIERYRKAGMSDSREVMAKPNYFAAMMVQYGLADAIVDLVSSGGTLRANNLVEVEEILPISARLIVNQASMKTRSAQLEPLIAALEAAVANRIEPPPRTIVDLPSSVPAAKPVAEVARSLDPPQRRRDRPRRRRGKDRSNRRRA
jgi:hypothetical protein